MTAPAALPLDMISQIAAHKRTCPHQACGATIISTGTQFRSSATFIKILRCPGCNKDTVFMAPAEKVVTHSIVSAAANTARPTLTGHSQKPGTFVQIIPPHRRGERSFRACPAPIYNAYTAAVRIFPTHAPAAGAMARHSLEMILDDRGYGSKNLADSLAALGAESDANRRVSVRLLGQLGALREFGNFGLHVIRSHATSEIVEVEEGEVELCLLMVEELIDEIYDRPLIEAEHLAPVVAKLRDAGKTKAADALEATLEPKP